MRLRGWASLALLLAGFVLAGCSQKKSPSEITSAEKQVFDSAAPEIKQAWLNGLEAVSTNDYALAQNLFYSLLSQNLSPLQKDAVSKESTFVMNRVYDGVAKGDPAAVKAMEEMRRNPPNRQPRQ